MAILWSYYGHIMAILWSYYGHIMAILWPYYGYIMAIIWPYFLEEFFKNKRKDLFWKNSSRIKEKIFSWPQEEFLGKSEKMEFFAKYKLNFKNMSRKCSFFEVRGKWGFS